MRANPVGWFEIYVSDMARAKAFYERTLGMTMTRFEPPPGSGLDEMWMFPARDDKSYGANGALVRMRDVPVGGGGVVVYFSCDDCAVEAGRVAAAGGAIIMDKLSIGPSGYIAIAKDSEGNPFGLHSRK